MTPAYLSYCHTWSSLLISHFVLGPSPQPFCDNAPHILHIGPAHSQSQLMQSPQAADWHKGAQFCLPILLPFPAIPGVERGVSMHKCEGEKNSGPECQRSSGWHTTRKGEATCSFRDSGSLGPTLNWWHPQTPQG